MEIPHALIEQVRAGKVALVLGAGANIGAKRPDGNAPPLAIELRDLLSKHFLGNKYSDDSLAWVAELAISSNDLRTVQDFIAQEFNNLQPAEFHKLIPTFRWRGIVTTNYDCLIEQVYSQAKNPIQEIVPFLSNDDRVDEKLRSPNHLGLLKLHGCIRQTDNAKIPFILTSDQYATHRIGRDRLFNMFMEWGTENTIVFIGHAVQDPDLRSILLEISSKITSRPRYYLVKPNANPPEVDFWNEKRISVLQSTFSEFLEGLDSAIPSELRPLLKVIDQSHPIKKRYIINKPLDSIVLDFLQNDVQYIHSGLEYENSTPQHFFKGFELGWYPILEKLDVRRQLTDIILNDVILRSEEDRPTISELYLIKAEAGAGKTIFLRRLAWEASTEADILCLFAYKQGVPSFDTLQEIHRSTSERIFLFIDDAGDNTSLISSLLVESKKVKLPLTILTAERTNEWNVYCENLTGYLNDQYQLRYLNHKEIEKLVNLLKEHNSLGPYLINKSFEEQVEEFEQKAGRQLLVALYEATMGIPLEEILLNEYQQINPPQAQSLYITVCVLNRLNVPVRAGLIARVHGIGFDQFQEKFFAPLEHVVHVQKGRPGSDYNYIARHSEIAQIVFERVLTEPNDRYNEYVRILKNLNISYSSDRISFRGLVRAKSLHELFPNYEDVKAIYEVSQTAVGPDPYLYQQMANYERIRPGGNYQKAQELLRTARELAPRDSSIIHTSAELARTRAENSTEHLERMKFRREARSLLSLMQSDPQSKRYATVTLAKLENDDLVDLLKNKDPVDRDIDEAIRNIDRLLEKGKQEYPDDHHLLAVEAEFAQLINDNKRVHKALQEAFNANPRDPYIAGRLAKVYEREGNPDEAKKCLSKALDGNTGNKKLNYQYACLIKTTDPSNQELISYHFRRAFSKWDNNYEAQFWCARYEFENAEHLKRQEAKEIFRRLRSVPMNHAIRIKIRDKIMENNSPKIYTGTVSRAEIMHGFIEVDGHGDYIFFHKNEVYEESIRNKIRTELRVSFNIGFSFKGPEALDIKLT